MSTTTTPVTLAFLTEQLELSEQLESGRDRMQEPQDLPGRYGRVVRSVDRVLAAMQCESVVGGGWAVWRHGFVGRLTIDLDIVLPQNRIEEFLCAAGLSGFDVLPQPPGRWTKVLHKETGIKVDFLPEGARPGMVDKLAPTTIRSPSDMGACGNRLSYIELPALIELKLAEGRARDDSDLVELVKANPSHLPAIRQHLATIHADYVAAFDRLLEIAGRDQER